MLLVGMRGRARELPSSLARQMPALSVGSSSVTCLGPLWAAQQERPLGMLPGEMWLIELRTHAHPPLVDEPQERIYPWKLEARSSRENGTPRASVRSFCESSRRRDG